MRRARRVANRPAALIANNASVPGSGTDAGDPDEFPDDDDDDADGEGMPLLLLEVEVTGPPLELELDAPLDVELLGAPPELVVPLDVEAPLLPELVEPPVLDCHLVHQLDLAAVCALAVPDVANAPATITPM